MRRLLISTGGKERKDVTFEVLFKFFTEPKSHGMKAFHGSVIAEKTLLKELRGFRWRRDGNAEAGLAWDEEKGGPVGRGYL